MKDSFRLEANPVFKLSLVFLFGLVLIFVSLFFATSLDRFLPEKIVGRLAFLSLIPTFVSFVALFIIGMIVLVRKVQVKRTVWIILIFLLASHLIVKLAVLEKAPLRTSDEADMVLRGKYIWNVISGWNIWFRKEQYYPLRPYGHSLIIKMGGLFSPLTFDSAIRVNICTATVIIFVVFMLSFILFGHEWLSLLCAFFLAVNSIFTLFSVSADYSISALFYSLTADLFIAAYLRRGDRLFLITGLVSLVLTAQSRPEYILYPIVILTYLFIMVRRQENRFLAFSFLTFLLLIPHFLMTCIFLKNHPVPNYFNDLSLFKAQSTLQTVSMMVRYNLGLLPSWLQNNGTSSLLYLLTIIGIIEGIRRYRIQALILILPMAVLFIGILVGNTRSFVTIAYSINFQPYLCILSALGIYSFMRPGGGARFRIAASGIFALLLIISSLQIFTQLRALHSDCVVKEIKYLSRISNNLNRQCVGIEKIQGFFEPATGIKTFPVGADFYIVKAPCLYFFNGFGSLFGDQQQLLPKSTMSYLRKRYQFHLINRTTICGENVEIYLLKNKNSF